MIGIGISIPMMMPFAEDATAFVRPGVLRAPFVITRAQLTGVQSSAINSTNNGLTLYGADVPRFTGSAQRLLIEDQRTNGFGNARLEGAVAGNPGTPPTTTGTSFLQGLSSEIAGTGVEDNIPYVDVRFFGTATGGTGSRYLLFNPLANGLDISNNKVSTFSAYVKLQAGSLDQISDVRIVIAGRDASNVEVPGQGAITNFTPTNAALGQQRRVVTFTPSDLSVLYGAWAVDILRGPTATVDVTLRIGLPQHELGAFASSPILPPVGTPGASTRGADVVTASLSSLGIAANGACTVLLRAMMPQLNATTGLNHSIMRLDDNSLNNMFLLRNSNGANLTAFRFTAGVSASATVGTLTAGTPFAVGVSIDGAGRMAVSLGGAVVVPVIGGPTSGLITFRLGAGLGGENSMFGEVERLRILPYSVSDGDLQSLVGALP